MYARIATFESTQSDQVDEAIEANRRQIESALASPPPGLEGVAAVWMLVDRESGTTVDLTLFETEDGLHRGDAALAAMSPTAAEGERTSAGLYEIAFRVER
jgi:hypothetical protein